MQPADSIRGWFPAIDQTAAPRAVPAGLDIGEIAKRANTFRARLEKTKSEIGATDFEWYPYDSWGNLQHLDKLLKEERRFLLDLIFPASVLDIGCADGELSFFFESLGCKVQAIDWPPTNHNSMRGVKALKEALRSSVEIHTKDLDAPFSLPSQRYGLVLLLGVLYHLKNVFYVLETLARQARYCILSTRVARVSPDKGTSFHRLPMAYLLDKTEANNDPTNYWIFSEAGLRRILDRAGWEICDYMSFGNTVDSDPASWEGDERAFCFLKSRVPDAFLSIELLRGWHALEQGNWRWTEKRFSIAARTPVSEQPSLRLEFRLPPDLLASLGPITLAGSANGIPLPWETYREAGAHIYACKVPAGALTGGIVRFDFELDKALPPSDLDRRELGIVVSSVRVD